MRVYEFALVLTEETGKDETKAKKLVSDLITKVKGKVKDTKVIGVRDLSYQIKKFTKGWYGVFTVELPEDGIVELEKLAKVEDKIIRHLLLVKA